MIDGIPCVDAHIHAARLTTLKSGWLEWAGNFGKNVPLQELHAADGRLIPERFDAYLEREGVDVAIMMCEYSPRVTGIQPVEDLLPLLEYNPRRLRFLANVNPHLHFPIVDELERQLDLGAVGLKIHPVHGGFPANERELYPAYWVCQERGIPVVFHCGTSVFPGSTNRYAEPTLIEDVARDFPNLTILLAHGGRGWWYDAAAFMALMRPNVWIELSGLPPKRLPDYYRNYDLDRLARKFVFGTDWPGVPGIGANARAVIDLGFDRPTLEGILYANAQRLYRLGDLSEFPLPVGEG